MDNNEILLKTLEKENKFLIDNYKQKYSKSEENIKQLEEKCGQEKILNQHLMEENNILRRQLDSILYSRSYKIIQTIKKILGRK